MSNILNSNATTHLPIFVTEPGQSDVFMIIVAVVLLTVILLIGVFYFTLHSLPEKLAQGANREKMQLVGILTLVALFTHNNYFWIAALLVAAVRIPDFLSPLRSMARSAKDQNLMLRTYLNPTSVASEKPEPTAKQPVAGD